MSKKKASLTMTLKDFHGGSIPSQLALPSAPGSNNSARPPDRPGAWGISSAVASGRSDLLRPRPGSAGAGSGSGSARGLDDRPPAFLPDPPHIGWHFDEDERKPFDASSAPRRAPAPDDSLRSPPPPRSEPKRSISSSVVPPPVIAPHPVPAFLSPSNNVGSGASAWGPRKEAASELPPPLAIQSAATVWSASRLAQASAVEKVSSGRWQSKAPELDFIRFHETEVVLGLFGETVRVVDDIDKDRERERLRAEASADFEERAVPEYFKEKSWNQDRARSPLYADTNDRNAASFRNESARPASTEGRFIGSKGHQQGTVVVSERPKIKLLPRGKPLESSDIQTRDFVDKPAYNVSVNLVQALGVHEMHGSTNLSKPGSAGSDEGIKEIERPRLNLKPRTHPIEQPDGNADKERQTVFGGARPRELVLKERGIDVAATDLDVTAPLIRVRNDVPKTDSKAQPNGTSQPGERADRLPVGQRTGKDPERKGYRPETVRGDLQSSSWKIDSRKNNRENGKPPEQPRADADNWRKPVEQPKPETPTPPRYGKATPAIELAQAFSRSVSNAKPENRFTSQRSVPGETELPFSRLTDSRQQLYPGPAHRQINGY